MDITIGAMDIFDLISALASSQPAMVSVFRIHRGRTLELRGNV
jgi:hypothetical protein